MGVWTYYSPLWLGTILAAFVSLSSREAFPPLPPWGWALIVGVGCPLAGAVCQLAMVGAQGAFAQVLPVPWGRSIRGRGAVVSGGLLLACIGFGVAATLVGFEGVSTPAIVVGSISGGFGLAALGTYIWCAPTASRDFSVRD